MTWFWPFSGVRELSVQLTNVERHLMSQIDELRGAIAQVGVDLGEAVDRVEAKLAESGVDLTADIEQLRSFGAQLDSIAVEGPGSEGEPPVEEVPGEELPFDPDNPT